MVSRHISDEGVGVERGKKERKKKINQNHLHLLAPLVDSKAGGGKSHKMATEALPVKRIERFLCQRAQQTLLNNVINHSTGPLSLPHKETQHTNNYTL